MRARRDAPGGSGWRFYRIDRRGKVAARRTAGARAHHLPEQAVVRVTARVVAQRAANVLGHGVEIADQVFHALAREVVVPFEGGVGLGDVSGVVFAMVNFHGLGVDVRLQRIGGVRQVRQFVGHEKSSVSGFQIR